MLRNFIPTVNGRDDAAIQEGRSDTQRSDGVKGKSSKR